MWSLECRQGQFLSGFLVLPVSYRSDQRSFAQPEVQLLTLPLNQDAAKLEAFAGVKIYQRKRLEEKMKKEQEEKLRREDEKKEN
ncbi:small integral membrane protein 11 isoform X2 [Tiliqua scincoides]|uniref:small integral membrane protein 11 isoform X2 n=1 Tax=Tiliqua scincoides TaxID=71010 RepID=UPI00346360C2